MISKSLIEVSMFLKNEFVEPVSYVFKKYCDYDYVISEDVEYNPDEGEPKPVSEKVTIKSYINDDDQQKQKISYIQGSLALIRIVSEIPEISIKKILKKDWLEQKFPTVKIGSKFIITNEANFFSESRIVIRINPGLGFGTGHHPTTKMMLERMETYPFKGKKIFDFGCGSGILSLAAKKLGANVIKAIDIDELAIKSAEQNAKLSKLNEIEIKLGSIESLDKHLKYEIILANISSAILIKYANDLFTLTEKKATLLCSGILDKDRNKTIDSLESAGFFLKNSFKEEDWVCLEMKNYD